MLDKPQERSARGYSAKYGAIYPTRQPMHTSPRVRGYSAKYGDVGAARMRKPAQQKERQEKP